MESDVKACGNISVGLEGPWRRCPKHLAVVRYKVLDLKHSLLNPPSALKTLQVSQDNFSRASLSLQLENALNV